MSLFPHAVQTAAVLALLSLVSGCALERAPRPSAEAAIAGTEDERSWGRSLGGASSAAQMLPAWEHYKLPGKQETLYDFVRTDGRVAVRASSESSASMLRTTMAIPPQSLGQFHFSWKVAALIEGADLGVRESDDAPARIVLAFDGDRSRFTVRESAMSELARAITGEEMPYATLMYVWCNHRPPGTVILHPRSSRIRAIVVESGPAQLGHWNSYSRDVAADFERAFGESPGKLIGAALMTDSDNTRTRAQAWYGPLRFDTAVARATESR